MKPACRYCGGVRFTTTVTQYRNGAGGPLFREVVVQSCPECQPLPRETLSFKTKRV